MASVGELWLVDFGDPYPGEPSHHRRAFVVGPPESFGGDFPFVFLCPLTSTHRGLSLHVEVELTADNGLDVVSYVQCEQLRSVNRRRLMHRLGWVDHQTTRGVTEVLKVLLNH
jgi:mRNA interferase MazF